VKLAPRDVALKIVEQVPASELVDRLEVAGPGFVNIWLNHDLIQTELNTLLDKVKNSFNSTHQGFGSGSSLDPHFWSPWIWILIHVLKFSFKFIINILNTALVDFL